MSSPDIDAQGAAFDILDHPSLAARVNPPPVLPEVLAFKKNFLERCIQEDPPQRVADWNLSLTRYGAGGVIAAWFAELWDRPSRDQALLADLREWLASMYRRSPAETQLALVNATLEHLFERPAIRDFFAEWARDRVLCRAFEEAALWQAHGGTSPLVGRRRPRRPSGRAQGSKKRN